MTVAGCKVVELVAVAVCKGVELFWPMRQGPAEPPSSVEQPAGAGLETRLAQLRGERRGELRVELERELRQLRTATLTPALCDIRN
ncbi:hypothetical protein FQN53_002002 [Emmonsiellopsis sp. PD_33]|nr:hypothetical protein FQN53_002002 [Emmonsiellopsis sp. PD_33]